MVKYDLVVTGALKDKRWEKIYQDQFERAMLWSVIEAENEVRRHALRKGLRFQGTLTKNIHGKVIRWDRGVVGVTGAASKYAEVMELGRRPGSKIPPTLPLTRWVWLKLRKIDSEVARFINQKPTRKVKRRTGGYLTPLERQKQRAKGLGIAIAKQIHRKGIKGRRYVKSAARFVTPRIEKAFEQTRNHIEKLLSDK